MNKTSKTAIGAMVTALSVVILIPTALEAFVYALPAFAGMLTMLCVVELGKNWACAVYASTALVSLIIVPNKEACILYVAFFGYYPVVKSILESKLPKFLEYICKFAIFNTSSVLAYLVLVNVMGLPFNEMMGIEQDVWWSKYAIGDFLFLGNLVFLVFDICLTRIVSVYLVVWQKKFKKMFRFK